MTISARQKKANKANAQRSTGPTSALGKQAVKFNSVTHGATSRAPVLPGENPAAYPERLIAVKQSIQPQTALEHMLCEEIALASIQRERATFSDAARVTRNIHTSRQEELRAREEEAAENIQKLFHDERGPLQLYPKAQYPDGRTGTSYESWNKPGDHPMRLVMTLEATQEGCRALLTHWRELRARIAEGGYWQAPDRLRCVRLLGCQPLDCADNPEVAEVYLCAKALDSQSKLTFGDVVSELNDTTFFVLRRRLDGRNVWALAPADATAARERLLALVDRHIERLSLVQDQRRMFDDTMNGLKTDIMWFDDSKEGEMLRRHSGASERAMHRAIATIIKLRKDLEPTQFESAEPGADGAEAAGEPAQNGELVDQSDRETSEEATDVKQEVTDLPPPPVTCHPSPAPADAGHNGVAADHETGGSVELQSKATAGEDESQVEPMTELEEELYHAILAADGVGQVVMAIERAQAAAATMIDDEHEPAESPSDEFGHAAERSYPAARAEQSSIAAQAESDHEVAERAGTAGFEHEPADLPSPPITRQPSPSMARGRAPLYIFLDSYMRRDEQPLVRQWVEEFIVDRVWEDGNPLTLEEGERYLHEYLEHAKRDGMIAEWPTSALILQCIRVLLEMPREYAAATPPARAG